MSHRKKLILWPGFGSLLAWFVKPELGIGLAMIVLVLLAAYLPAAHAERPLRSPKTIALGAFLIWFAALWLIVLAAMPFQTELAEWVSAMPMLVSGRAALSAIVVLYALAGLVAGAVQILVLRRNGVPVRASYSLVGLTAGFVLLGWSFAWHEATGNDMTIILPTFLCGLPALMLLESGVPKLASRFPIRAVLRGVTVNAGGAAVMSGVVATGIAGLAFVQSALSIADLNPLGPRGTTPLSLALLWLVAFAAVMGFALLFHVVRLRETPYSLIGDPSAEVENPVADTDGWSVTAIMLATGLVGMAALLLSISLLEAVGFRLTDVLPRQVLVGMLVALFMVSRGKFGEILDFVFLGVVAWGIYGLYVIMTLDPVNQSISNTVEWLVPG